VRAAARALVLPIRKCRPCGEASPATDLLPRIERACAVRKMKDSRFGRRAVNDPGLVERIRSGRGIRAATREKIEAYLRKLEWMAAPLA